MQPAEMRERVDGAIAVIDGARLRRVAVERLMASRVVVVRDVLIEDLAQVRLVQRHQVVGALAADAADDALAYGFCQGECLALMTASMPRAAVR